MPDAQWKPVDRNHPCAICQGTTWCTRSSSADGDFVTCQRWDQTVDPPGWFKLKDSKDGRGKVFKLGKRPPPKAKGTDWNALHIDCLHNCTRERIEALAANLGLPVESLRAVEYGYLVEAKCTKLTHCWTSPEKDASGRVIGLSLRTAAGEKRTASGSARGLAYCKGLLTWSDPILIVEGASDVAACHAVGIPAVGRPSDRGGVAEIIRMCQGRECIVVGEFDPKPNGDWPGRDSAIAVSRQLSDAWGRAVRWTMPPPFGNAPCKDIRRWVCQNLEDERLSPQQIGSQLLELLSGIAKSERPTGGPGGKAVLANSIIVEEQDAKGRPFTTTLYLPLHDISEKLTAISCGWPRRVGGALFVADKTVPQPAPGELATADQWRVLETPDDMFAWVHAIGEPQWTTRAAQDRITGEPRTVISKPEFHASLRATAMPHYDSIEILPHYPRIDKSFYLPCELPPATGEALEELMAHMNAKEESDRKLMLACFLTMAWGGPPGKRPAFIFCADQRGVGKTRTAEMLSDIWGGCLSVGENEDWDRVRSRLLAKSALDYRCVLIDNIKSTLNRSGLESAITAQRIDGHKMYAGQATRVNNLTWIFTSNSPSLSNDLTERSVIINIGSKRHADRHEQWWQHFLKHKRAQCIADALAVLERGTVCEIPEAVRDRWAPWQEAVLQCIEGGDELASSIREARPAVDQDLRDAEGIRSVLYAIADRCGANMTTGRMLVKKSNLTEWLVAEGIFDNRISVKRATLVIRALCTMEPLKELSEPEGHGSARSWLWVGVDAQVGMVPMVYDRDMHGGPDQSTLKASDSGLDFEAPF